MVVQCWYYVDSCTVLVGPIAVLSCSYHSRYKARYVQVHMHILILETIVVVILCHCKNLYACLQLLDISFSLTLFLLNGAAHCAPLDVVPSPPFGSVPIPSFSVLSPSRYAVRSTQGKGSSHLRPRPSQNFVPQWEGPLEAVEGWYVSFRVRFRFLSSVFVAIRL